ncbi:hypothetical protein RRG08_054872 [Elysia crispata]|uniref:Uncharacterized protein n=1 Tax=Elysia crispata TaxID=231223 RepID=A0AAE1A5W0_9GAST|nr:hypothetical protein RRG08_054872 [Elysia crispata]
MWQILRLHHARLCHSFQYEDKIGFQSSSSQCYQNTPYFLEPVMLPWPNSGTSSYREEHTNHMPRATKLCRLYGEKKEDSSGNCENLGDEKPMRKVGIRLHLAPCQPGQRLEPLILDHCTQSLPGSSGTSLPQAVPEFPVSGMSRSPVKLTRPESTSGAETEAPRKAIAEKPYGLTLCGINIFIGIPLSLELPGRCLLSARDGVNLT